MLKMTKSSSTLNIRLSLLTFILILVASQTVGQVVLGSMESWGFNGVSSDDVMLMSDKKMKIQSLEYNGQGPAAWFMLGKADDDFTEEFTNLDGVIIPDESGSCDRLGRYSGDDIELTLPGDMKFTDYDYLSIYCIRFSHNFGYIPIKKDITFPAAAPATNATTVQEEEDDLPGECPQNPETRGGGEEDEEEEEE